MYACTSAALCCRHSFPCGGGGRKSFAEAGTVACYDADEVFKLNQETGYKAGYAYDYIEILAKYADWDVEYDYYPGFTYCLDAVKDGRADLAFDVSYTEERAKYMTFPEEAMGSETYYLYFLDTNRKIFSGELSSLQNTRIAVTRGTKQIGALRQWLSDNGINAEIIEYENGKLRKAAVLDGRADLQLVPNRYEAEHFIAFGSIGKDDFYFVVNPRRPDILEDVNSSHRLLMSIDPYTLTDLNKKYFLNSSIRKSLSSTERKWLEEHPVIRIGCLEDDAPFSYYDKESGSVKGMTVDIIKRIFDVLDIGDTQTEFRLYSSHSAMQQALDNHEIDLITPYYHDNNLAAKHDLILSREIFDAQIGIVRRKEVSFSGAFKVLACQTQKNPGSYAITRHPESQIITCDTLVECLEAVSDGRATGTTGISSTLSLYAKGYPDLEFTPLLDKLSLCYASSRENVPLVSLLDKGRILLQAGEIDAMQASNQPEPPFSLINFIRSHLGASIFLLVLITSAVMFAIFMSYANRRLKAQNQIIDRQNTAMKEYQDKLQESLRIANVAAEAKTNFLFNMSHDIRTPMNAIVGFTDLLEKNLDNKRLAYDYIRKIQSSNDFLLSLINNVLEMARIDSGKASVDESYIDVNNLHTEIISVFEPQMREKGLDFVHEMKIEHSHLMLDSTKAREIILNILSNALKYTPSGGTVRFIVEEVPYDVEGCAMFVIKISDTGIGMPKEFLPHLYESFSREKNTTQSGIMGTGLGMNIVKKLVDLLGGTIEVESELGKGSAFTLHLPCHIAPEHHRAEAAEMVQTVDSSAFQGRRILLAEDNELNAEIAIMLLEDKGFVVDHAKDGVECVDMLERAADDYYSAILMDVQMPRMDGYTATRTIRSMQDSAKADIPIVAMTANAFDTDKQTALEAGMNDHVPKPFDVDKLFDALRRLIH